MPNTVGSLPVLSNLEHDLAGCDAGCGGHAFAAVAYDRHMARDLRWRYTRLPATGGKETGRRCRNPGTSSAPSVASTSRLATEPGSMRVTALTNPLAASLHGTPSGSSPPGVIL